MLVNFDLVVSLPGGLEAQEISGNSHFIGTLIPQDIAGNLLVILV